MNKISILHISDIHKGPGMSLTNLKYSLIRDSERWEEEGIRRPDYIVLSGDVVQGGATDEEICQQYKEAEGFLSELCDEFLQGRRERMIIVPGNHDVSWPHSSCCMEEVDMTPENIRQYRQHLDRDSLRWDWNERKLFRVHSTQHYARRFDRFIEFFNHFYDGIYTFPEDVEHGAICIPFAEDRICFACFNSCCQNDHLNDAGAISKNAVLSIEGEIREFYNQGMLPIGVWHHNAYGDPYQSDYMSKDILDKLLEHRIKIGLYGHQHKSQVAEEYADLLASEEGRKRLLLVSSGTLYGGDREQLRGIRRQFNIIELEMGNGEAKVLVHVREDSNNDVCSDDPYWRAKDLPGGAVNYYVKFRKISDDDILRFIDDNTRKRKDYVNGINALRSLDIMSVEAKNLQDSYLEKLDNKSLLGILKEPENIHHCFMMISAVDSEHDAEAFNRLRNSPVLQSEIEKDSLLKSEFERLSEKF